MTTTRLMVDRSRGCMQRVATWTLVVPNNSCDGVTLRLHRGSGRVEGPAEAERRVMPGG
ncbi:hypothetical protein SAMN06272737_13830 [Blastococcus mobilis]|uniref:Uncharacterized protein n=1 Tax=Blastococcus mobilis TaxID=1938746 RepID=A0A239A6M8_9ACTN|nr:hypothetical protein SAMN06272737_13830 [Blastococcus mobilis]